MFTFIFTISFNLASFYFLLLTILFKLTIDVLV